MRKAILARHLFGTLEEKILTQNLQPGRPRIIDEKKVQVLEGLAKVLVVDKLLCALIELMFVLILRPIKPPFKKFIKTLCF